MTEGLDDDYEFCGKISLYMNPDGQMRVTYNLSEQMAQTTAINMLFDCVTEIKRKARSWRIVAARNRKKELKDPASPQN